MEQKRAGCFTILVGAVLLGAVLDRCSSKHSSEPPPTASTPAAPAQTPGERLTELKAERQTKADFLMISLGAEAKIRRDLAIVRDPELRKLDPFPDPNEEQQLLDSLDKIVKDNAKSKTELDTLDAEIAKEQVLVAPSPAPDVKPSASEPSTESNPPAPRVDASQAQIEANTAAWKRSCTLWQDESIKTLFKEEKLPDFIKPSDIRRMQEDFRCGIFASMVIQKDGSIHSVERWWTEDEYRRASELGHR
jgi:hypothetical protein